MRKIKARELIDNLINHFGELQYGFVLDPTTGKLMPSIAGTLKATESDRRKALKLLNELEKRRILYEKLHDEQVELSVKSVIEIRDYISTEIIVHKRESLLIRYAKKLIDACQEFLNLTQRLNEASGSYYSITTDEWRIFRAAIKRLRAEFAKWLYQIVIEYEIDIDEYLARIIPVSPSFEKGLLDVEDHERRA